MTANKPEVLAYHINKENPEHRGVTLEPLIRLAEYEALQAECEKLRAAIRRLCDTYVVDDYYDGQLRKERLDAAVNQAIDAAGWTV